MLDERGTPDGSEAVARLRGRSGKLAEVRNAIRLVAPLDSTVLLTGETGSGKGLTAKLIHNLSPRAEKPFVHVDCAALSPNLIESELFGHEKGAFTNASSMRQGRFEWARDGTVFLDEIGDLEPHLQTKLLRVLDDRAFERLGGVQTIRMRARIVAATSHDLAKDVREGLFRSDLFFRLSVFHFTMPALRERAEDLPDLVLEAIDRLATRLGVARPVPSEGFLAALAAYPWPGNVRELLNLLERVVVVKPGRQLQAGDLAGLLQDDLLSAPLVARDDQIRKTEDGWSLSGFIEEVDVLDRREIIAALRASRGSIAAAARRLKIPRSTLRHRMKKHGLSRAV